MGLGLAAAFEPPLEPHVELIERKPLVQRFFVEVLDNSSKGIQ